MSGHIFFKERWYGFDDALYTAARLLEIVSKSDKSCSEIFDELPVNLSTPENQYQLWKARATVRCYGLRFQAI